MAKINLMISSAKEKIFEGEVDSVYVPAKEGDFQILKDHAPILAALEKGKIKIRIGTQEKTFDAEAGFLEAHDNKVTLLIK